jgi:hypothetical protein
MATQSLIVGGTTFSSICKQTSYSTGDLSDASRACWFKDVSDRSNNSELNPLHGLDGLRS